MRFMVIVKANEDSEAGVMPSEELLERMTSYNEELVRAAPKSSCVRCSRPTTSATR